MAIDNAAATAFFTQHGERATALPPVAIAVASLCAALGALLLMLTTQSQDLTGR